MKHTPRHLHDAPIFSHLHGSVVQCKVLWLDAQYLFPHKTCQKINFYTFPVRLYYAEPAIPLILHPSFELIVLRSFNWVELVGSSPIQLKKFGPSFEPSQGLKSGPNTIKVKPELL